MDDGSLSGRHGNTNETTIVSGPRFLGPEQIAYVDSSPHETALNSDSFCIICLDTEGGKHVYQGSRMHACRRWHSDLIGNKAAIPAHRLTNQGFEDGLGLETLARSLTEACARSLSEEPLVVKAVVATSPPKTPAHVFRGPTHLKDITTACEHVGRNLTGNRLRVWCPRACNEQAVQRTETKHRAPRGQAATARVPVIIIMLVYLDDLEQGMQGGNGCKG